MILQYDYVNQRKVRRTAMVNEASRVEGVFRQQGSYECNRCNAAGYLPHYRHVEGGICFKCNGSGTSTYKQNVGHQYSHVAERLHLRRWYIGLWIEKSQHQILFSYTSESASHAQDIANTHLNEKGISTESPTQQFRLISGSIGEKKADVVSRIKALF